jgi:hypothetical protein
VALEALKGTKTIQQIAKGHLGTRVYDTQFLILEVDAVHSRSMVQYKHQERLVGDDEPGNLAGRTPRCRGWEGDFRSDVQVREGLNQFLPD